MSSERILIIDDSAEMRDFLVKLVFRPAGYVVDIARNGFEGLASAINNDPDLIVSDIAMPEMDGLEMVEELRRSQMSTPVILMTAEGSEAIAVRAMRAGVMDYFVKPFDPVELQERVKRILSERKPVYQQRQRPDDQLAKLQKVVQELTTALIVADNAGNLVLSNDAGLAFLDTVSDVSVHQITGRRLEELTSYTTLSRLFDCPLEELEMHGELRDKSGGIYNTQVALVNGVGRAVTMHDITILKQLDRVKTEYVTSISHDLRSPLTAILSYVALMSRSGNLSEEQINFTEQVEQSVKTITALINDLLNLDKIEAGLDQQRELVSLVKVAEYAIEAMRSKALLKRQELLLEAPQDLPLIRGNPARLRQVFVNLIDNAVKYTPENGKVQIVLYDQAGQVMAAVSDTGIGIPVEDQPNIFERNYRSSNVEDTHEGMGLGLSIVASIIEAHGGRIWVDSSPDAGATFTLLFSAREDNPKST